MALNKKAQQLARQLFKLSLVDGRLNDERVAGVLAYVEKTQPANTLVVLKAYLRLVEAEVARNVAVVEHAGDITPQGLQTIAAALTKKYGRAVTATSKPNPALLAGLRVQVGDDVYESSVAGQLSQLSTL